MRRSLPLRGASFGAVLLLAACGAPDESAEDVSATVGEEVAAGAGAMGGVPTTLKPLEGESSADLGETLGGCSFEREGETLLVAGAPADADAPGRGVIRISGGERMLETEQAGGPDYINAGPVLGDGEFSVTVERAEGEGEPVGAEATQWPADLIVTNAAGEEWRYTPGTWTCGV
jgi:hypothetical protein